jgi:hypothetical protein
MLALTSACDEDGAAADGSDTTAEFDAESVGIRAAAYADTLERVNAMSRPSAHGLAATVDVYVSPVDVQAISRSIPTRAPTHRRCCPTTR